MAESALEIKVDYKDLQQQLAKFAMYPAIVEKHVRRAMKQGVTHYQVGWQAVAPVDTGAYRGGIKQEIKGVGMEIEGIISTSQRSPRGFPYPKALEESPRYHYRRTERRGQRTMGQVRKMVKREAHRVHKYFGSALGRIVKELAVR